MTSPASHPPTQKIKKIVLIKEKKTVTYFFLKKSSIFIAELFTLAAPSQVKSIKELTFFSSKVKKVMLTNDLTESVYREACDWNANLIISYHPPIFAPMKKLVQSNWKDRIITGCIENRIAIYSPHTSYDALAGGVNDWLLQAFGEFSWLIWVHCILFRISHD